MSYISQSIINVIGEVDQRSTIDVVVIKIKRSWILLSEEEKLETTSLNIHELYIN